MSELPVELFHAILDQLKDHSRTLLNLRRVSKTINELVTPLLFEVIVVQGNVKSAQFLRYCGISVKRAVREVVIEVGKGHVLGQRSQETAALVTAVGLLKLTSAERLRLDCDFDRDSSKTQLDIWFGMYLKLLEALAINPSPSLTSLELVNIMAIPDSLYSREDLFAIFRPLKKLEIAAIRGDCRDASLEGESDGTFEVEGTYTDPQLVAEFWDTIVPSVVRRATALTSLTLRTNQWIGGHPAMSFKDIFLPQLSELVLQKFHLEPVDPDYDIVQFVIRHKATLTRLDLRHCAIGCWYNDQGWRSWHAVFTTFAMELGKLTEFVFLAFTDDEEEDEFGEQGARFLYSHSLGSADYEIAELDEDVVEGDRPAFEHLQRLVLARKSPGS